MPLKLRAFPFVETEPGARVRVTFHMVSCGLRVNATTCKNQVKSDWRPTCLSRHLVCIQVNRRLFSCNRVGIKPDMH